MTKDSIHVTEHWDIKYEHSAGDTASRFLRELRDNQRVLGRKCPECERVLTPPRGFCSRCFVDTDEWVEVGPGGHIESFTVVPEDIGTGPEAPFAIAYVELDGADTSMVNEIKNIDLSDPLEVAENINIGDRVTIGFEPEEEREGRITDFHYKME